MNVEDPISRWLITYAEAHGLGELTLDVGISLALEFDGGITVHLDRQEGELVLHAPVGEVTVGDTERLEALMSANLLWRDTDGATLGLEPYSRTVILARSWPLVALAGEQAVQHHLDQFCHLAASWRQALGA